MRTRCPGRCRRRLINDAAEVAGDLTLPAGSLCTTQAGVYTAATGWQPIGACGASVSSYDLNELGDVLIQADGVPYVLFEGIAAQRVEDLIVTPGVHWSVNSNVNMALNDKRQMAVYATNGAQSGIILITPDNLQTCQANLGFGGPGALQLSMCGGDLSSGTTADVVISGAAPHGATWLLAGLAQNPTPFKGGTLLTVPLNLALMLPADGGGVASILGVPGGNGPVSVFLQAVAPDGNQPDGWAISNALRADFQP